MALEKSQVLLVLLILCQIMYIVSGTCNNKGQCWKSSEVGRKPVDFHLCGTMIPYAVKDICNAMMSAYGRSRQKNRKSVGSVVYNNPKHAKRFRVVKRTYNIVEECCTEGCIVEEVREYC